MFFFFLYWFAQFTSGLRVNSCEKNTKITHGFAFSHLVCGFGIYVLFGKNWDDVFES